MENTILTSTESAIPGASAHDPPTVFVLDGDSIVRSRVSALAQAMHLRCEEYLSGHEFLAAFDLSRSGCLVTEVRTAEVGGLEVQRRLATAQAPLPIVFLSAYATVPVIVRAMRMGAIDFLEKPPDEHRLWEAIQEAVREDDRRRTRIARSTEWQERIANLEPHEQLMLEHIGQGVPMREVADYLGISVRTAEIRRSKLMQKLRAETYVELLRYAFAVLDRDDDTEEKDSATDAWSRASSLFSRARGFATL